VKNQTEDKTVIKKQEGMVFYKTAEVAKRLHVSLDTVVRWIREKRLNAVRTAGGHYRISEEDIENYLKIPYIETVYIRRKTGREDVPRREKKEEDEDGWFV
jgi:excisionase family DNA binding protein